MPPKAKPAAKAAPAADEDPELHADFQANVQQACKLTGFAPSPPLLAAVEEVIAAAAGTAPVDGSPVLPPGTIAIKEPIGPPNVRALCAAILARGTGLKPKPYKVAKSLLLHNAEAGDSGAAAIADVLRNGILVDVGLESVSLLNCGIGRDGAAALGSSLMLGANGSLTSLVLDCNAALGDAGVRALCKGLRTNRTLKRLSLAACGMGPEGAEEIAVVVASPACVLEVVDVSGNDIGLAGLLPLAVSARHSRTLQELGLCNCRLSSAAEHAEQVAAATAAARAALQAAGAALDSSLVSSSPGSAAAAVLAATAAVSGSSAADGGAASGSGAAGAGILAAAGGGGLNDSSGSAGSGSGAGGSGPGGSGLGARAFGALGEALSDAACPLGRVDLDGNPLTPEDADALIPHVAAAPSKLTQLRVPVTLPPDKFAALWRNVAPAKGKKGGAKKKK